MLITKCSYQDRQIFSGAVADFEDFDQEKFETWTNRKYLAI